MEASTHCVDVAQRATKACKLTDPQGSLCGRLNGRTRNMTDTELIQVAIDNYAGRDLKRLLARRTQLRSRSLSPDGKPDSLGAPDG